MSNINVQDLFAEEVRSFLGMEEGDYYYEEFESGLDHHEIDSQSQFAWDFFLAGIKAAERIRNEKSTSGS